MKELLTILIIGAIILIVGVVFILSLLGIFKSTSSNGSNNNPPQEQQDSSNGFSVSINNFAFDPDTLTINKGETVTWTNEESASHDIVGDTFESTLLKNG